MTDQQQNDRIRVAVVTGGHPFNVPDFWALFNRMPQFEVYIQELDNWAASRRFGTYDAYDAFVFYNMHVEPTLAVRKRREEEILEALNQLGEGRQGIFVLHHALLAFPDMQVWNDICNVQDRKLKGFKRPEPYRTLAVNQEHPITRGLDDWEMTEEVFLIDTPTAGSEILLTTDHPESMRELAWAHTYKNARVVCYQAGHDNNAYANPSFQTVLARGIEWLAGRR